MNIKKIRIAISLLVITFFSQKNGFSESPLEEYSYREGCRQELVGMYLTILNDIDYSSDLISSSKVQIKKITSEKNRSEKKVRKYKKIYFKDSYNINKKEQYDSAFFVYRQLIFQEESLKKLIQYNETNLRKLVKKEKRLISGLGNIFLVSNKSKNKIRKYEVTIRYRSKCERFKYICPLSLKELNEFNDFFKKFTIGEICKKYINFESE